MKNKIFTIALLVGTFYSQWLKAQEYSKTATTYTQQANEAVLHQFNFADSADFIDARRGFIATLDSGVLYNLNNQVVINTNEYTFLNGDAPVTVNPSLWRQAQLNSINGIFKVIDGVYQV
jgi:alkyl sulfatase BDS1-like metallo-beta-lactamase superfamily hydrolase